MKDFRLCPSRSGFIKILASSSSIVSQFDLCKIEKKARIKHIREVVKMKKKERGRKCGLEWKTPKAKKRTNLGIWAGGGRDLRQVDDTFLV